MSDFKTFDEVSAGLKLAPSEKAELLPEMWPWPGVARYRVLAWNGEAPLLFKGKVSLRLEDGGTRWPYLLPGDPLPQSMRGATVWVEKRFAKPPENALDISKGGSGQHWFMSERMHELWKAFDPDGFDSVSIDYVGPDRKPFGFRRYFVAITRSLAAIDYSKTLCTAVGCPDGRVKPQRVGPIGLRPDIPKGVHMFLERFQPDRPPTTTLPTFLSEQLVEAMKAFGTLGWRYFEPADYEAFRKNWIDNQK